MEKIVATGSKGNAVIIGDVLFDIGIPLKQIKPYLDNFEYIIITHKHGDHLKPATLAKLINEYHKQLWLPIEVLPSIALKMADENKIISANILEQHQDLGQLTNIVSYPINHDVVGSGYGFTLNDKRYIYMTDTADFNSVPDEDKFDVFYLEANYSSKEVINALANYDYHAKGNLRHASQEQNTIFKLEHQTTPEAITYELHQSGMFS
jgi:hypothetical protein